MSPLPQLFWIIHVILGLEAVQLGLLIPHLQLHRLIRDEFFLASPAKGVQFWPKFGKTPRKATFIRAYVRDAFPAQIQAKTALLHKTLIPRIESWKIATRLKTFGSLGLVPVSLINLPKRITLVQIQITAAQIVNLRRCLITVTNCLCQQSLPKFALIFQLGVVRVTRFLRIWIWLEKGRWLFFYLVVVALVGLEITRGKPVQLIGFQADRFGVETHRKRLFPRKILFDQRCISVWLGLQRPRNVIRHIAIAGLTLEATAGSWLIELTWCARRRIIEPLLIVNIIVVTGRGLIRMHLHKT